MHTSGGVYNDGTLIRTQPKGTLSIKSHAVKSARGNTLSRAVYKLRNATNYIIGCIIGGAIYIHNYQTRSIAVHDCTPNNIPGEYEGGAKSIGITYTHF